MTHKGTVTLPRAILVFLDGTVCDMRHRIPLQGTDEFFSDETILKDTPTAGSVAMMSELAEYFYLFYIGARPHDYVSITKKWLALSGFPDGDVYLGKTQYERMEIVKNLKGSYGFVAGIGDRWDDNELHLELGCQSFILKEWEPNWEMVRKYLR
ncbi:MAG: hypothetical protein LBK46_08780 [Oscillospiraceae bacterium]|jgi:hypothetical protein|nr:hypothetical protein [Oscillospiraceae bacterium]